MSTSTNELHRKECLARAIISAVENFRDNEAMTSLDFRIAAQDNAFLPEADGYLADGLQDCTCGARQMDEIVEVFATDPDAAQRLANDYLRSGVISPEDYLRVARQTQALS